MTKILAIVLISVGLLITGLATAVAFSLAPFCGAAAVGGVVFALLGVAVMSEAGK